MSLLLLCERAIPHIVVDKSSCNSERQSVPSIQCRTRAESPLLVHSVLLCLYSCFYRCSCTTPLSFTLSLESVVSHPACTFIAIANCPQVRMLFAETLHSLFDSLSTRLSPLESRCFPLCYRSWYLLLLHPMSLTHRSRSDPCFITMSTLRRFILHASTRSPAACHFQRSVSRRLRRMTACACMLPHPTFFRQGYCYYAID